MDDKTFLTVQEIIDEGIEMVINFDDNGVITYANKIAMQLLDYADIRGVLITRIFPSIFETNASGNVVNISEDINDVSTMAYRSNQTCFRVRAKFMPSKMRVGTNVCLAIDVSAIEALEKEINGLKENTTDVNRVKGEFVANVTHELRTPVNGILGNTRELISRNPEKDELKILQMIERGCEDMNALINNILDFSKLDAGKFQLEPREFDFRQMIDYVKSNHLSKVQEKGLEFFVTVSGDIPEKVVGDELRIVQILNNMLSNAIKFTAVGRIMMEAVATARVGNRLEIFFMIMDTGIGIDKKNQDKLFKSFSQVEASISRRFGGTGLGLNISKQLVELMGGHINVESELGKGTTFTFSIWLEIPEEVQSPASGDFTVAMPTFESLANNAAPTSHSINSPETLEEINKRLMKLTLCIEMSNWEKAEMFAEAIKQLTLEAPREISSTVFRLKMAVQKENQEKAMEAIEKLNDMLKVGE